MPTDSGQTDATEPLRPTAWGESQASFAQLEREGLYTPPSSSPPPWPEEPGGSPYADEQLDALIDEIKGEH